MAKPTDMRLNDTERDQLERLIRAVRYLHEHDALPYMPGRMIRAAAAGPVLGRQGRIVAAQKEWNKNTGVLWEVIG